MRMYWTWVNKQSINENHHTVIFTCNIWHVFFNHMSEHLNARKTDPDVLVHAGWNFDRSCRGAASNTAAMTLRGGWRLNRFCPLWLSRTFHPTLAPCPRSCKSDGVAFVVDVIVPHRTVMTFDPFACAILTRSWHRLRVCSCGLARRSPPPRHLDTLIFGVRKCYSCRQHVATSADRAAFRRVRDSCRLRLLHRTRAKKGVEGERKCRRMVLTSPSTSGSAFVRQVVVRVGVLIAFYVQLLLF